MQVSENDLNPFTVYREPFFSSVNNIFFIMHAWKLKIFMYFCQKIIRYEFKKI